MLMVLSPAKSLNPDRQARSKTVTEPEFIDDAAQLVGTLRKKSKRALGVLMNISDDLAALNHERFRTWSPETDASAARRAVLLFDGDVYSGLDVDTLAAKDLQFAQKRLRILSGLYGVLRPLDAIAPYRLEMGTDLTGRGWKNLYDFWGDRIADSLAASMRKTKSKTLVNLASDEYFRAVRSDRLDVPVIKPVFKERRQGKWKVISFSAKKARGLMARYAVTERLDDAEDLKSFDLEGYSFRAKESTDHEWLFGREQPK